MNRRTLLATLPAVAFAKPFSHPIGLNLYTVRASLAKSPADTYKALGQIGIEQIEVRPDQLLQHGAMMKDAGLKPVHMMIETASITGAWEEWEAFGKAMAARMKLPTPSGPPPRPRLEDRIELAAKNGLKRIGTSMLRPSERATAIDAINKASRLCNASGIELYYHNHAYEFDGEKGARYIDRLHRELDPKVRLELDIFWASITRNNPVELLAKWKGRVKSIHLKDMNPEAVRPAQETDVPPTAFRELGKGSLNLPAILKAAAKAGVEHYLIELDYSPGDPIESVRNCHRYLKEVSL